MIIKPDLSVVQQSEVLTMARQFKALLLAVGSRGIIRVDVAAFESKHCLPRNQSA